ncbi:hypothetical protein CSTERLE_04945 [Thermoclostridium stercorarium subsp. leptospartum DSM 9219]|uniref:Uncharacterized protein n=1 Tax=Thermoclostridium stercorarium subsp. leptospartum DSM 9219 TaxID=1346611 RepID=A0A1B1YJN2_THEST|nr:hypothetical protein CSTERLE_04945 [Thermoclostridium stercorarium subsp. leptospartum DSM 9219]
MGVLAVFPQPVTIANTNNIVRTVNNVFLIRVFITDPPMNNFAPETFFLAGSAIIYGASHAIQLSL